MSEKLFDFVTFTSEMAVLTFLQLRQGLRTIFFSIVDKKGLFIGKQDSPFVCVKKFFIVDNFFFYTLNSQF
jgi:hypothetical protein